MTKHEAQFNPIQFELTSPHWNEHLPCDPLLAEVNLFREAYTKNEPAGVSSAREYSYWNNRTALIEALFYKQGISLTRQDYRPSEGGFFAFGQAINSLLSKGVGEISQRAQNNPAYLAELGRRRLELREEQLLEELARSGGLDNQLMLVISPYPEELSEVTAKELGYQPQTRSGKLRIHSYRSGALNKETAEIFFTESSLAKTRAIAKALGKEELFRSLGSPSEALGQPIFLDKSSFPDYLSVLNQISPVLYDDSVNAQHTIENSRQTIARAQPLLLGLAELDEELAKSLILGKATSKIKKVLNQYLEKIFYGAVNLSYSDEAALHNGLSRFDERTASVLKKIALINTYVQVGDLAKQPTRQVALDLFDNQEAIGMAMAMGAAGMSYCGVNLNNPYGAYGWGPEVALGVIFGAGGGASANEQHLTHCPYCGARMLVSEAVHGRGGIRCSCGKSVNSKGALCIVRGAKVASSLEKIIYNEAEVVSSESFD